MLLEHLHKKVRVNPPSQYWNSGLE